MAAAGTDAVMICGISREPVWIEIAENSAQFHPAKDFWGLDTCKTEDRIRSWLKDHRPEAGKAGVLTIGPAGENRLAHAVIANENGRSAGAAGAGAVMGSKNVKAVAFWGRRKREAADPGAMKRFAIDLFRTATDNPVVKLRQTMGTPMPADIMNESGVFPTRGRRRTRPVLGQSGSAAARRNPCEVRPRACPKCVIACSPPDKGACRSRATGCPAGPASPADPRGNDAPSGTIADWDDRLTLFDTLIICRFYRDLYQWEQLAAIIAAATGMQLSVARMRAIAARVTEDTRRFNRREGLASTDGRLRTQFPSEPAPESGSGSAGNARQLLGEPHDAAREWNAEEPFKGL
jgi:aldehyde:ferredoxin oxidoreductase